MDATYVAGSSIISLASFEELCIENNIPVPAVWRYKANETTCIDTNNSSCEMSTSNNPSKVKEQMLSKNVSQSQSQSRKNLVNIGSSSPENKLYSKIPTPEPPSQYDRSRYGSSYVMNNTYVHCIPEEVDTGNEMMHTSTYSQLHLENNNLLGAKVDASNRNDKNELMIGDGEEDDVSAISQVEFEVNDILGDNRYQDNSLPHNTPKSTVKYIEKHNKDHIRNIIFSAYQDGNSSLLSSEVNQRNYDAIIQENIRHVYKIHNWYQEEDEVQDQIEDTKAGEKDVIDGRNETNKESSIWNYRWKDRRHRSMHAYADSSRSVSKVNLHDEKKKSICEFKVPVDRLLPSSNKSGQVGAYTLNSSGRNSTSGNSNSNRTSVQELHRIDVSASPNSSHSTSHINSYAKDHSISTTLKKKIALHSLADMASSIPVHGGNTANTSLDTASKCSFAVKYYENGSRKIDRKFKGDVKNDPTVSKKLLLYTDAFEFTIQYSTI